MNSLFDSFTEADYRLANPNTGLGKNNLFEIREKERIEKLYEYLESLWINPKSTQISLDTIGLNIQTPQFEIEDFNQEVNSIKSNEKTFKDPSIIYVPEHLNDFKNTYKSCFDELLSVTTLEPKLLEDKIMLVLSMISFSKKQRSLLEYKKGPNTVVTEFKRIFKDVLREKLGRVYIEKKIFELRNLIIPILEKYKIIDVDHSYTVYNENKYNSKGIPKGYRINHLNYRLIEYRLTSKKMAKVAHDEKFKNLRTYNKDKKTNHILKTLDETYEHVNLPTLEEILHQASLLTGTTLKNGKILEFTKDIDFNDLDNYNESIDHKTGKTTYELKYSVVEDSIDLFDRLTKNGFLIPLVSKEYGRVVDSFTLMPHWIRELCKIDGQELIQVDFSCLHPNIAVSLFGSPEEKENRISHQQVLDYVKDKNIGITSLRQVKNENLKFFNQSIMGMQKNKLNRFYNDNFPEACLGIKKVLDKDRAGVTKTMFKKEAFIMAEVCKKLNTRLIYVYDAIFVVKSRANIIAKIMDEVVFDLGINTVVKIG